MTNLRVWIRAPEIAWLAEMQAEARTRRIEVSTFPVLRDDLCYELVPVSREQLEREADEAIKALDEELK